jgi:AraC-like DNA-binding protein
VSLNFDLDDMPASKRFKYWRDIAEGLFVPVSLTCDAPETFRSWRNGRLLGNIWAGTSLMTQLSVSRTRHHIARSSSDAIKLVVPLSGEIAISQDKREALIRPGEFYLVDPVRPYEEKITEDLTFIWLHLPREAVASKLGRLEKLTATGFGRGAPYARLTADFILSLSSTWDDVEGPAAEHVGSVVLDLFTMALWERMERVNTHGTTHRSALFQQARAFIDEHLGDPGLSLGTVGAVLGVSSRYVSELLAEAGLSYRRYVLEQRLARCAKELADPRVAHRTVTDVAYSWGFYDSAHFSRAFKGAFGLSPSDFRAAKLKL